VNAVVGAMEGPIPINDFVRPCCLNVEILGVDTEGNGTIPLVATLAGGVVMVSVAADGVRVVRVGEGGNTKSV